MFRLLALILTILSCLAVSAAQPARDGVEIYFKVGRHNLDRSLRNNGERLDSFATRWSDRLEAGTVVDSVIVEAYASPEGSGELNERLAKRRLATISQYLRDNVGVSADIIRPASTGIAWERLRVMVEADSATPSRDDVLGIINDSPEIEYDVTGTRVVNSRLRRLQRLGGGGPYRWMLKNIFPKLRHSAAIAVYGSQPDAVRSLAAIDWMATAPTITVGDPVTYGVRPPPDEYSTSVEDISIKRFAIKTNLLYDAILMPSLEFEWMINDKWSAAIEGNCAWWKNDPKHKYYQILTIIPEAKYWFKTRKPWHGMYVGAFAGGGKYDLENGYTGYKGEGGMAGISYGYSWTLNDHFALEAGIGVGVLYTRYKEYIPIDTHYVYQYTRTFVMAGPLRLKLAIAYRFYEIGRKFKKKGGSK